MTLKSRPIIAHALAAAVGGVALLAIGCGRTGGKDSQLAAVKGDVTFDGSPLPGGTILFIPAVGGGRKTGAMIHGGHYSIPQSTGPSAGKYRVEIYSYGSADAAAEEQNLAGENQAAPAAAQQWIPEIYNKNSTVEVEIVAGNNRHDFPLVAVAEESQPPAPSTTPEKPSPATGPRPTAANSAAAAGSPAEEMPAEPAVSDAVQRPAYVYTPTSAPRRSRRTWYTATVSVWLVVLVACFGWWQYNVRRYHARQLQKRG